MWVEGSGSRCTHIQQCSGVKLVFIISSASSFTTAATKICIILRSFCTTRMNLAKTWRFIRRNETEWAAGFPPSNADRELVSAVFIMMMWAHGEVNCVRDILNHSGYCCFCCGFIFLSSIYSSVCPAVIISVIPSCHPPVCFTETDLNSVLIGQN